MYLHKANVQWNILHWIISQCKERERECWHLIHFLFVQPFKIWKLWWWWISQFRMRLTNWLNWLNNLPHQHIIYSNIFCQVKNVAQSCGFLNCLQIIIWTISPQLELQTTLFVLKINRSRKPEIRKSSEICSEKPLNLSVCWAAPGRLCVLNGNWLERAFVNKLHFTRILILLLLAFYLIEAFCFFEAIVNVKQI